MGVQKSSKQGTKGAKQIIQENLSTLAFYRNMSLGSAAIFIILNFLLSEFSTLVTIMTIICFALQLGSYQFMIFMCRPNITEDNQVLDSGNDLNMEGGIAEHVKDLIILTSFTLVLALISNYFWFLLLLAPIRAISMLWGSVIQPWLTHTSDQAETEAGEKKQMKMDRKMKRMR